MCKDLLRDIVCYWVALYPVFNRNAAMTRTINGGEKLLRKMYPVVIIEFITLSLCFIEKQI